MEIRMYLREDGTKSILFRNKGNGRVRLLTVPAGKPPDPQKVREAIDYVRPETPPQLPV